ncbi:MAG: hypothetical protein V3S98_00810 [Dehalococcoidia bacterium]
MTSRIPDLRQPRIVSVLAVALIALVAACGGSDPTPTPTPTPTPVPSAVLSLAADATVADFIRAMPDEVRACIRDELGEGAARLFQDVPLFGGDNTFLPDEVPLACLTQDILADIVIAGLADQTGGLSDDTVTCIRGTFQTVDIPRFIAATGGDFDANAIGDVIGSALTLLLCLTDSEADRVDLGAFEGGAGGGLTLGDLRCVVERVDINDLLGMFDSIASGNRLDLSTGFEVAAAFQECGADLFSISSEEGVPSEPIIEGVLIPDLSDVDLAELEAAANQLVECFEEQFGEDIIARINAGEFTPSLGDIGKLAECDIDLSDLGNLNELLGQ